jgi:hypothetical protein
MFGAREADLYGTDTITYCVLYTFEELFEMLGIVLFNYALLTYLVELTGGVRLVLELPSMMPGHALEVAEDRED